MVVTLRQVVSQRQAAENPRDAKSPEDRRTGYERRASDRRRSLLPLESRDSRLRFAAQAAGFGTYYFDCATGDSLWSPELRAIAGLPLDNKSLSTEEAESLIHHEDREAFLDKLLASLDPAGCGQFEYEHRIVRVDGETRWVKTKGQTFFAGKPESRFPLAATGIVMDITASRMAEQELKESREELDKLLDSAIDAVITIDTDQRIVRFNPSAARIFHCLPQDAINSPLERFIPERFRASHQKHVSAFADGGTTARTMGQSDVFSGRRADGEEFPIEATIAKVQVGERRRMTVFLRDVTERVQAQEALRRSKEVLELAIRGAGIGLWHCDLQTRHVEASARCRQLFGISLDEPLSIDRIWAAVHPDDRPGLEPELRRAFEDGVEYLCEKRFVWPDGSVHWLQCIGRQLYDETTGAATGLRGISLDITERKRQDQALRRSKEDLELAVRGANIGIWHWDMQTGQITWSDRCYQLFGIPIGEPMTYERYMAAIHPDDRERVEVALKRALQEGGEYQIEKKILWPDGTVHWVEGIARNLYDADHNTVGMRGIVMDITERKRQEEALYGRNAQLENSIEDRTKELLRSNEALARSNQDLQQFAFIAAHDLQTPLRSISGFAQLIKKDYEGRLDKQATVWLDQLVRSTRQMHAVIQDILAYSRVESQGKDFELTEFNDLFDGVVMSLDALIQESGAEVVRSELPAVLCDRVQLGQVLQNLVENGIKYRSAESPRIQVSAQKQPGEWLFAVRDNGIGIAEKHLDNIFQIFRRLHTAQQYPGTGIGLAICRRIVHRHGGRIWVESAPGQGSTFYFTLPCHEDKELKL